MQGVCTDGGRVGGQGGSASPTERRELPYGNATGFNGLRPTAGPGPTMVNPVVNLVVNDVVNLSQENGKTHTFVIYTAFFQEEGLPHLYHTSRHCSTFATPLPQVYHGKVLPQRLPQLLPHFWGGKIHILPRASTDKAYHEVYHKVYDRMAVDVLSILEQKCEGFNSHLGGVDSVVWARFDFTPLVSREGCANS